MIWNKSPQNVQNLYENYKILLKIAWRKYKHAMFLDGNAQYYTSISPQINSYFNVISIKISMGIFYGSLQKSSDKLNAHYLELLTDQWVRTAFYDIKAL